MRRDLEQKLIERWPTWFDFNGNLQHTLMPLGFEHGDGWFSLLWRLCEDLEPLVAEYEDETGHQFQVVQVKEKFGGLRFYVEIASDVIRQRIELAEMESSTTCETCGEPGGEPKWWVDPNALRRTRGGKTSLQQTWGVMRARNKNGQLSVQCHQADPTNRSERATV